MPEIHVDSRKERQAAILVAREMAAEGMSTRQVRRELDLLEIGSTVSDLRLYRITSRHRPWWKIWFPWRYRIGRRLLGGTVALICIVGLFLSTRTLLQNPDAVSNPKERLEILRQQGDALVAMIQWGLWFAVSAWLFLRPEDGDEKILEDSDGLAWRLSWFH